ncbi:MAG: cupin domain-containing protein [Candidatus Zixiibacteriota bacterium]
MPVRKYNEIEKIKIAMEGVVGTTKMVPLSQKEGWEDYTMRVFNIAPGGHTPKHAHDWEHVNYIMSGRGRLTIDGKVHEVETKDFAFVPPNTLHQFENPYDENLEFICIVSNRGEY